MPNTSVVESLRSAGLYKETGRIEEQMLKTITPNGEVKEHKMAEMDYLDLKTFADELDIALKIQNPRVQELFAKNAVGLANLVRAVNVETASGFKGTVGAGRQLDAILLRAEQFQNPGAGAGVLRASWATLVGAIANVAFIQDLTDTNAELAMAVTEGFALLGFANPAAQLCVDAVQITYLAQAYNIQNLDFELANPFVGDAICELKQPLYIFPQESAAALVRYYRVGSDELRPIGIWVKMSQNLRLLATS
ncbi:hypothetical protein ES703_00342 [subsurface metagenome]